MPMMVHLTPARNVRQILRTGIRKSGPGVYCMPVLQDYYTSHQWLRELRRWGPGPFVAVYFRLADAELVQCGPYWQAHQIVRARAAVHLFRQQSDAQGWEILVPRSIASRELHKIQPISQVLGWRYSPASHTKSWCNCPYCVSRGEFNSSKKREQQEFLKYGEIITSLHRLNAQVETCVDRAKNDNEMIDLLTTLRYRKAGQASDFLFLIDYPSDSVIEAVVDLLGIYKSKTAKHLLHELAMRSEVRSSSNTPPENASALEV